MTYSPVHPPEKGPSANVATLANWAGAIVSLGLVVGVGVWGYKLMVRDVSGIPVIEASGGPMRVAPENPGGDLADHQGLAVNDVAGTGGAAPPPSRVVLAPRPVSLGDEDQPLIARALPDRAAPTSLSAEAPALAAAPEDRPQTVEELADFLARGATPLGEVAPGPEVETTLQAALTVETPPARATRRAAPSPVPPGGLARSLRPHVRPGGLRTASLAAPVPDVATGPREVDPATLPKGTRLAQLGAYDSAETARKEWDRIDAQFGEFLEGKGRVIEKATSGGRTFYRLRVEGFADLSDARRFCAALVAGRAECIPVTAR